jgi:glutaredoxin
MKMILYTTTNCGYCKTAKRLLENFMDQIQVHDTIENGMPDFQPATPSLYAFDQDGNVLDKLDGLSTPNEYVRFLRKYYHG